MGEWLILHNDLCAELHEKKRSLKDSMEYLNRWKQIENRIYTCNIV